MQDVVHFRKTDDTAQPDPPPSLAAGGDHGVVAQRVSSAETESERERGRLVQGRRGGPGIHDSRGTGCVDGGIVVEGIAVARQRRRYRVVERLHERGRRFDAGPRRTRYQHDAMRRTRRQLDRIAATGSDRDIVDRDAHRIGMAPLAVRGQVTECILGAGLEAPRQFKADGGAGREWVHPQRERPLVLPRVHAKIAGSRHAVLRQEDHAPGVLRQVSDIVAREARRFELRRRRACKSGA